MRIVQITLLLFLCVILIAQEETKTKKRKVYRTQTGAIIEAPRPLFERSDKKEKTEPRIKSEKSKALARTKKVETTYRNELKPSLFPNSSPTDTEVDDLINFIRGVDTYDEDADNRLRYQTMMDDGDERE